MAKAEKTTKKVAPKAPAKKPTAILKAADLRKEDLKVLASKLVDVQKDLTEAHRTHAAGELVNPRVLRNYRKDIARLKTVMVEKAREASGKEDA